MEKLRIAFLASHGGSNMQAIIDNVKKGEIDAELALIISNNSTSGAIERAKNENIPYAHISGKTHPEIGEAQAILNALEDHKANLIILAGYMKKIDATILRKYAGRILNIHPALLPKYGGKGMYGMYVHEAVIKAKEKVSGPTVHLVDEVYDNGRILLQKEVPVMPEDTPEDLAARVLKAEHWIYSEVVKKIAAGEIEL